ncbi:hypothetical protein Y023_5318 [Burkholderia pseudomallei A79D]|nr:hypothetical protein Y023_5318 [Burkholderia pseudomallei A79D]
MTHDSGRWHARLRTSLAKLRAPKRGHARAMRAVAENIANLPA